MNQPHKRKEKIHAGHSLGLKDQKWVFRPRKSVPSKECK